MVLAEASIEEIVPAMFRNVPHTISAAASSLPSALRVPRARSWSPGLISSSRAGFASSNLIESGAYLRTMVSLAKWMVTVFFSPIPCWVITMEFAAGSMLLTNPPTPCLRHSSRSWVCFSAMLAFFIAIRVLPRTVFPSWASCPRTRMRSPGSNSCKEMGAASFKSFCPGSTRSSLAPSCTTTVTSPPASVANMMLFPETDLIVPTGRAGLGA